MSAPATDPFWARVRDLFQAAAELPAGDRAAMLDRECSDARVRAEVDSLLAAHDQTDAFLEKSVWDFIDAAEGDRLAGATIGPYRVVRQLGHGGMGTVFLAVRDEPEFAQRVAIKLVRGGSGQSFVQRFRQERQILAALEHPNIARLLDGGTTADGLPYLAMEYVDGVPIDEYCRERALAIPERLRLFLLLCDAVQYAHRNLVIHRDIKPANVLVTAAGVPKLLDFGIAKLVSPETRPDATVTRLMTPEYASPEQLLGEPVSTATDVYSLGVLLFELLTGEKPFTMNRTPQAEAPRPSTVSNESALRGDLDTILLAAMEVDPLRRYGSVEMLAEDVRRHLSGHPIAARRPTFRYRTSKFVRRNKLGVAAAAAMVIVIAAAFVATLHQKRIAERRFDQVRSLARSVVFEIHDAIAPLPGSTPARELLVRRALVYLDNLAAEARSNVALEMELAGAYLKIGDVQGLPYHPNLGDTRGALTSYRKALAIAESVRGQEPENDDALRLLADAHDRIGFVEQRTNRWANALRGHETARELRESLSARTPGDDLALAKTWVAIGDDRYIGARSMPKSLLRGTPREAYESALRILERLPRGGPHHSELLMETGRAHQHLGGYFTGLDRDLPRAIRHHDAALQALGERVTLHPANAVARRNYADQFVMKATAQNMALDGAGALQSTDRALAMLGELAAADPKNVEAQHDLAFAHGERGRALALLGRSADAVRAFDAAIAIHERRIAVDASSQEDRRDLARIRSMRDEAKKGENRAP